MSACTAKKSQLGRSKMTASRHGQKKQDQQQLTVGRNNDIQTLRVINHPHRHGINEHLVVPHNALVLLGNLIKHLVPQHHTWRSQQIRKILPNQFDRRKDENQPCLCALLLVTIVNFRLGLALAVSNANLTIRSIPT